MDPVAAMASPEVAGLAAEESERFASFLSNLNEKGWRHPVPACPNWTVRDLTAHTAFVAEMYGGSVRKSLAGNPGPVWEDMPAARKQRVEARTALDDAQLLADYREHVAEMNRTLANANPDNYLTPAWHPRGMWSVGRLLVAWFWEVGIHCHDLRSSFDQTAGLDSAALSTYVEYLTRALERYLGPESDPDLAATYRFVLGDLDRTISVRLANGAHEIAVDGAGSADVTFRLDGTTWVLSTLNRIDPAGAMADGRIRVEGDQGLAARYWRQLKRI